MIFRKFRADDFSALYAVEERCFEPWVRYGAAYMRDLLKREQAAAWIAEEDGTLAGFAIVEWSRSSVGMGAYLQTIEVAPEFRGRGIGSRLLRLAEESSAEATAKTMLLHVDAENDAAIGLYEKIGYKRRGRSENYYQRGKAALLYVKELHRQERSRREASETRSVMLSPIFSH